MRKDEIQVGGLYRARVSGKHVTVRVDAIRDRTSWNGRNSTVYDVTNLSTGRKTTFRSAAKFRGLAETTEPESGGEHSSDPTLDLSPAEYVEGQSESQNGVLASALMKHAATAPQETEAFSGARVLTAPSTESGTDLTQSFASKIASTFTGDVVSLTPEQEAILSTAKEVETATGQRVVVIGAGAGTGKTFTLKQLESVLQGIGQYTAFNSSLVAESKSKFRRAACNTTHSLAFRAIGHRYKHRLNGPRVKSYQIAARLGIEDFTVELPEEIAPADEGVKQTRVLKASYLAGQVTQAIRKFCQSADICVSKAHFQTFKGLDKDGEYTNSNRVKDYLLPFAQKMWADLNSKDGTLPFSHDVYVKIWALGEGEDRPIIAADYILLDEAQDTAPVMLDILRKQTHALTILVGDDCQQIYEWRGACNAMKAFPDAPRRLLSQSFRFGQAVADVANSVLSYLEEPTDLVMRGTASIPSRVCAVQEPECYLYRTNAGAISRLMRAVEEGKRAHLIGGSNEVVAFCRAARELQGGDRTNHPELGCFADWAEVQDYAKEDEGQDLRLMVKLIDEFGADQIIRALQKMPPEEQADLVVSTAHRSKGREWTSVRLGPDFPLPNRNDAELRLVYVAATRAQEELDVSQCPTFMGGVDKVTGEEIPGIQINYTESMPTEEELDKWRLEKSPNRTPAKPSNPESGIQPASTHPNAAQAILDDSRADSAADAFPQFNGDNGEFTWRRNGEEWCVAGPEGQTLGKQVTVTRKNGTTSVETLRAVARERLGGPWFYSI